MQLYPVAVGSYLLEVVNQHGMFGELLAKLVGKEFVGGFELCVRCEGEGEEEEESNGFMHWLVLLCADTAVFSRR